MIITIWYKPNGIGNGCLQTIIVDNYNDIFIKDMPGFLKIKSPISGKLAFINTDQMAMIEFPENN